MERYAGQYEGQQYVGMRSAPPPEVLVRMTDAGELLEAVRIANTPSAWLGDDPRRGRPRGRAGGDLRVVLGGGHPGRGGAAVHLAHPLGVKAFEYRRVKNDERDAAILRICCGWAGCRRRGSPRRPPGSCASWSGTGPSWSRCARGCKAQVHAVLAKCGVAVPMSDLFGVAGTDLLDTAGS